MTTKAVPVPTSRVLHVPLTDAEWLALRRLAFEREVTLGTLTAFALQSCYPLTEGSSK
jgi:hypothetical protein